MGTKRKTLDKGGRKTTEDFHPQIDHATLTLLLIVQMIDLENAINRFSKLEMKQQNFSAKMWVE